MTGAVDIGSRTTGAVGCNVHVSADQLLLESTRTKGSEGLPNEVVYCERLLYWLVKFNMTEAAKARGTEPPDPMTSCRIVYHGQQIKSSELIPSHQI